MSEPRTKSRWGWWIATGLVICLMAAALRLGLPIYRRNRALAKLKSLDFMVVTNSRRPDWLARLDRWDWTAGFDSVVLVSGQHLYSRLPGISRADVPGLLLQITAFNELQALHLRLTAIEDADLGVIENLPELRSLDLSGTYVSSDGLRYLARIFNIRKLILTDTQIDDAGLAHLARLTNLEELHLDRTRISNAGLKHLAKLPNLRELSVSNTAVTDSGLDELLKSHPVLSVSDD
jgi:Leucine-rich repeat (LRR) protein